MTRNQSLLLFGCICFACWLLLALPMWRVAVAVDSHWLPMLVLTAHTVFWFVIGFKSLRHIWIYYKAKEGKE